MAIIDLLTEIATAARIVPLGNVKPDLGVPLSFGLVPPAPASLDFVQTGPVPILIKLPVTVQIEWKVKKKVGTTTVDATEGTDFVAPRGLKGPVLDLVFLAFGVQELVLPQPSPLVRFEISAEVTVKTNGLQVPVDPKNPVTTPSIPLDVPALLGIPTVLALFKHSDYASDDGGPGWVLLAVPENAVLKSANDLAPVLDTLRDTIKRLQSFQSDALSGNFATFLLGLGTLVDTLNSQPKFQFVVGDHGRLDQVVFAESGWRIFPPRLGGKEKAEQNASSVILIGVKGSGAKLWGDRDFRSDDLDKFSLEISVGVGMWTSIRNFNGVKEVSDMTIVPPTSALGGDTLVDLKRDASFDGELNDKISSIDFKPFHP
jgi:hypothetical protein